MNYENAHDIVSTSAPSPPSNNTRDIASSSWAEEPVSDVEIIAITDAACSGPSSSANAAPPEKNGGNRDPSNPASRVNLLRNAINTSMQKEMRASQSMPLLRHCLPQSARPLVIKEVLMALVITRIHHLMLCRMLQQLTETGLTMRQNEGKEGTLVIMYPSSMASNLNLSAILLSGTLVTPDVGNLRTLNLSSNTTAGTEV